MRMFVAALPPIEAIEDLSDYLQPRQEAESRWRWTTTEQWHLTLAFLPAVPDAKLDPLLEQLTERAAERSGFSLQLKGAGSFPNPAEARTLWAGVAGDTEPLSRLAAASRAAAVQSGVEVDGGRFRPHLTLARCNRPVEATRWLRVLDLYAGPSWPVTELALLQSHLGGGGRGRTRHQLHARFPLATG